MAKPRPFAPGKTRDRTLRCAIYTRKSTEEGLEQEVNSLDAQREACAAYILSQRHEGWSLVPEHYDDGGYSGGNINRPGLQQLLADVRAGKVDVIVVYKVDRLTRALSDFAKIVEILDGAGASFVSVTQSFNTTTSMGRLTLNVLLSFAQFEREVTGERIRDKIAASKAKGMWMGGPVPLGYDVKERKLVINEAEAANVRCIFQRYVELGSTNELVAELAQQGIRTKRRSLKDGRSFGGINFRRGALTHLLQNPVYVGEVRHKDRMHKGEHEPIIGRELWEAAQEILAGNRHARLTNSRANMPSLLVGMISDGVGRRMTSNHACRGSLRYRYYVSCSDAGGAADHEPWRIPAGEIEQLVVSRVSRLLLEDRQIAHRILPEHDADDIERLSRGLKRLGLTLPDVPISEQRYILQRLQSDIRLQDDGVDVSLCSSALIEAALDETDFTSEIAVTQGRIAFRVDAQFKRRGQELRLVFPSNDDAAPRQLDTKLIGLIVQAHEAWTVLERDQKTRKGRDTARDHLTRLARLRFLAPDIISAILDGRQPRNLTARQLLRAANLPLRWQDQREELGFA